jgi:hypothetical protein
MPWKYNVLSFPKLTPNEEVPVKEDMDWRVGTDVGSTIEPASVQII